MANITGITGFNPSSGTARLLAGYGNDIVDVATGLGFGLNLDSTQNVEFEVFLDRVFMQNYSSRPLTYKTSTNKWTTEYVPRTPRSKYIKKFKSRLFLGYCQFTAPEIPDDGNNPFTFPSRVFHSDLFSGASPTANLTWGLEWGTNGSILGLTSLFRIESQASGAPLVANFKAANIKIGDPLFITNYLAGTPQNPSNKGYLVTKVEDYRLQLDSAISTGSATDGLGFWVGSNWFDVSPDDGDVIMGFGENNNRLLIFKLLSLWAYTGSQLSKVQGALGTSSNRSVINDRKGRTLYFHGSDPKYSGIYMFDGVSCSLISRGIDPFIQAMLAANYSSVVAWEEGNDLRFYLGNLSATNTIEAMNNAVASYNQLTGAWSVDPIGDVIKCASPWIVSNVRNSYLGTDSGQILKSDSGNSFKTTAMEATLESKVFYPAGSEIICEFPYIQVIGRNLQGLRLKYKLWDAPFGKDYSLVDDNWQALGECKGDLTEFTLPQSHQIAAGIQIKVDELSTSENDWYVEKFSLFYRPNRTRLI